jgi:GNAT superfamily N-acetyltransferase
MDRTVEATMSILIAPFEPAHAPAAARMFVASLEALRGRVPALPASLADIDAVQQRLTRLSGVVAIEDGRLIGYLTSRFPIAAFRGTDRVGAYSPEWAHGALHAEHRAVDNALYRAAAVEWARTGCDVHAITLLAGDDAALRTWSWSGFGMAVVDAIRPTTPLVVPVSAPDTVRMASLDDAAALAVLDVEHVRHYTEAPVFMPPPGRLDEAAWLDFLSRPGNAAWLAEDTVGPYGFLRFDREFHGSSVTESSTGIFISGAYVRPGYRGRGAASAMLDAALRRYAADGITSCAVDFEAFNPEAATFWMRHFMPVCYSLMRVPEVPRGPLPG